MMIYYTMIVLFYSSQDVRLYQTLRRGFASRMTVTFDTTAHSMLPT